MVKKMERSDSDSAPRLVVISITGFQAALARRPPSLAV
ncbi:MAG: hypothetical protein RLZZ117_2056 [Cyanobacteriota bacterium]|jgi:hypothetical protein